MVKKTCSILFNINPSPGPNLGPLDMGLYCTETPPAPTSQDPSALALHPSLDMGPHYTGAPLALPPGHGTSLNRDPYPRW